MSGSRIGAYLPALILFVGALFVWGVRDQRAVPLAGSLSTVLSSVDSFHVRDQKVTDEERRIAGMTDYVARVYSRDTTSFAFTTYVGYYDRQTQGKSIHSPRNCLPGAGWEIIEPGTATVTAVGGSHVVNRYLLKNGPQLALVYYWYQGRGRVVASEYAVKLNLLRDAALMGHTEEALVRLVVLVDPADTTKSKADALAMRIAPRLMNEVERVLPRGEPSASRIATGPARRAPAPN
ncbi:MAG: exosortase C-terminal domain/associated protein EpsI [Gemmatimonadaceae bacterium]